MSAESFAALRRNAGSELADLAEEHYKHDLQETDRDNLNYAAKAFSTYSAIGSGLGLGLGLLLAFRVRSARQKMFAAFRAQEKPTAVQFANGRTEAIPDISPMLKPSTFGDIMTYTLFSLGGVFVFGELGMLAGGLRAKGIVSQDADSRARIETAFRRFRADVLRREADSLERGGDFGKGMGGMGRGFFS